MNTDGTASAPDFIVNETTASTQVQPHVTELPDGQVLVTWTSDPENTGTTDTIDGRILTIDNVIKAAPGHDAITGTADSDIIYANNDAYNHIDGGAGSDVIYGGSGRNDLIGGDGNDFIHAGTGADTLWGDAGNDWFYAGSGPDLFAGGAGIDTVDYIAAPGAVHVDLTLNQASGPDATGDTFNSIENLVGSNFDDKLFGDSAGNQLVGNGGNDWLDGRGGNDVLYGGAGADHLFGGSGIDTADYSSSPSGVNVNLALNTGQGGDAQGDTYSSIENVVGSNFDDTITGTAGDNVISGGAGNDTLIGGLGQDFLTGGPGSDTFVFNTIQESTPAAPDQILDFSSAQFDHIDVSHIDANVNLPGQQHFTYIGDQAFTHDAGQLRYDGHDVQGDVNGDGVADFTIHVAHVAMLTANDFIL